MKIIHAALAAVPAAILDNEGDVWLNTGDTRDGPFISTAAPYSPSSYDEIASEAGISTTYAKGDVLIVHL